MSRISSRLRKLFAVIAIFSSLAHAQPSSITGTWELTYVAPQAAMNTMPNGVSNQKLYFSETGKLYVLAPDQISVEGVTAVDYVFDGKQLKLNAPGAQRQREVNITFADSSTMVMTQTSEAKRIFKRVKSVETKLEPQSLQLVTDGSRSEDSQYDRSDYSGLPAFEKVKGMWEVIAYERVPRSQMPPYGFFNDVWKIDSSAVTIFRREPVAKDAVPNMFNGSLTSSGISLGGPIGSKIEWTTSFNEWGQLVLDSKYCRVVLKRTTAKDGDISAFPLKVVVVRFDGHN
ncbi:hypothetical protein PQR63_23445 [Herbaspirillum rhizosphaerae]|uniref:Lipocalin-like protein n=1 Tax=Herbaspirillum rhizosphaerae TaxID=346179 RepID=A0ABW8ZER0_9BURK